MAAVMGGWLIVAIIAGLLFGLLVKGGSRLAKQDRRRQMTINALCDLTRSKSIVKAADAPPADQTMVRGDTSSHPFEQKIQE